MPAKKKAKEKETPKDGFLKEISDKINSAKSMEDLEALNDRVYDIWADDVPAEIQVLAAKKAEEIEDASQEAKKVVIKDNLQKDWKKVTEAEVKKAEAEGKLAGFDPITMTADIKD